jgi:hypothetical protein
MRISMMNVTSGYDPLRIICSSSSNKLWKLDAVSWLALDVELDYWNGLYTQLQVITAIALNNNKFFQLRKSLIINY